MLSRVRDGEVRTIVISLWASLWVSGFCNVRA